MLIEKYFPIDSSRYKFFSRKFDILKKIRFGALSRLFGVWTIFLSGSSVAYRLNDRWHYWEWSTIDIATVISLALISVLELKFKLKNINSRPLGNYLFIFIKGFSLFFLGMFLVDFSINGLIYGFIYTFFYVMLHLVWSLHIDAEKDNFPSKADSITTLTFSLAILTISLFVGFRYDDPILSTISGVYSPFVLVALVFPNAIRHYQRLRIYGVFIPVFFIGVHFPWFIILSLSLFWILRYYHFFAHGMVQPTFKVIDPSIQKEKNG